MTKLIEGNIPKSILKFTLPLFISNLFQLLYNTADAFIVGNFIGSSALAAVGSSESLIFLLVSFFAGLSMGSGVVCARFFGQGDKENLKSSMETILIIAFVAGIALTFIGIFLAPHILRLMGTPEDVFPESTAYFRALFSGSLALVMYNMASGILQSVGDSKTPMKFLIFSSLVNIVLDIIFIAVMGLGVEFAGYATVISQGVSAILSLRVLFTTKESYRLSIKDFKYNKDLAKKILKQGIPSGIQMSVISIANVFVQANINSFGAYAMAGCGAHNKIQGLAFLPINCFTITISTFVSQNIGAGKRERVKKGIGFSLAISLIIAQVIGVLLFIFADEMVGLFSQDPKVIPYGVLNIRVTALFYFLLAYSHCCASIMRGYGRPMVPMIIMLIVWCFFRVGFIITVLKIVNVIDVVFWAYPVTWTISSVIFTVYVIKTIKNQGPISL